MRVISRFRGLFEPLKCVTRYLKRARIAVTRVAGCFDNRYRRLRCVSACRLVRPASVRAGNFRRSFAQNVTRDRPRPQSEASIYCIHLIIMSEARRSGDIKDFCMIVASAVSRALFWRRRNSWTCQ